MSGTEQKGTWSAGLGPAGKRQLLLAQQEGKKQINLGCLLADAEQSAFLLDPCLLSLEDLQERGLLAGGVLPYPQRERLLKKAYERFRPDAAFAAFCFTPQIQDGALYAVFAETFGEKDWRRWPDEVQAYRKNKGLDLSPYEDALFFSLFEQYMLAEQLRAFARTARGLGLFLELEVPFSRKALLSEEWSGDARYDDEGRLKPAPLDRRHPWLEQVVYWEGKAQAVLARGLSPADLRALKEACTQEKAGVEVRAPAKAAGML
jgi:hypothetical protein